LIQIEGQPGDGAVVIPIFSPRGYIPDSTVWDEP